MHPKHPLSRKDVQTDAQQQRQLDKTLIMIKCEALSTYFTIALGTCNKPTTISPYEYWTVRHIRPTVRKLSHTCNPCRFTHTQTATNACSPLSHKGTIRLKTNIGSIIVPAVFARGIVDTLISIRSITGPRTLVVFDENHAYAIPQCLLHKQMAKEKIGTWHHNAYVYDTVHSATTTCNEDRTKSGRNTAAQYEIPIPTSPILSGESMYINKNGHKSHLDLKIATYTLSNTADTLNANAKCQNKNTLRPKNRFRSKKVQSTT